MRSKIGTERSSQVVGLYLELEVFTYEAEPKCARFLTVMQIEGEDYVAGGSADTSDSS
jgi:hypothetical protein